MKEIGVGGGLPNALFGSVNEMIGLSYFWPMLETVQLGGLFVLDSSTTEKFVHYLWVPEPRGSTGMATLHCTQKYDSTFLLQFTTMYHNS